MNPLSHANGSSTDCVVSISRTIDEVEALRDFWQACTWHPTMDLDVYLAAQRLASAESRPYVLSFSRAAKPTGILVGRLEKAEFRVKLGYWSFWTAKLRAITIPYGGLLGDISAQNAEAGCLHLLAALRRGEADAVFFDWLPVGSELFKAARALPGFWWRNAFVRLSPHWKMQLPGRAEALWNRSRNRRNWVRRICKKIEADYKGKIQYRFFSQCSEVDALCRDAERVASTSYQRGLGVGFDCSEACCQRLQLYAKVGILRACVLYVDAIPRAFWIGSVYKHRFYSAYLAHDPGFEEYQPGNLVFIRFVEALCAEGAQQLDFAQGEAIYKERFGDQCDAEVCLYALSPSLRSLALNVGFSASTALAMSAKRTLLALNVLQSLKTRWRRRLARKTAAQESSDAS